MIRHESDLAVSNSEQLDRVARSNITHHVASMWMSIWACTQGYVRSPHVSFPPVRFLIHFAMIVLTAVVIVGEDRLVWSLQDAHSWQGYSSLVIGGSIPAETMADTIPVILPFEAPESAKNVLSEGEIIAPVTRMPLPGSDPLFQDVHRLADGEKLGDIASRYEITLDTLIWSNGLQLGDTLAIGQELRIPRISGLPYIIQPDDTLDDIAQQFNVSPDAILLFQPNMLRAQDSLPVGREIFIPGGTQPLPESFLTLYGGVDGLATSAARPAARLREMKTNMREGPNIEYARVAQFGAGRYAALLGRYDQWFKVDIAGVSGWIHRDLLEIPADLDALVPETNDFPPLPPKWVWPTNGSITSRFGPRWGSFHNGVDIANRAWTPIVAARAGVVTEAGWCSGYGYCVKMRHDGGIETIYGHLIDQPVVATHQEVSSGQVIGHMGSTYDVRGGGYSTGVHLHFTVKVHGNAVDPLKFLP